MLVDPGRGQLVAQSQIQDQAGRYFEIILNERGREPVASVVVADTIGDGHLLVGADEEFGHGIAPRGHAAARPLAAKAKLRWSEERLEEAEVEVFEPESHGVAITDPAHVLLDLIHVGGELPRPTRPQGKA